MTIRAAPDPVRDAARDQAKVSDPKVSAWVDASAGSGKTKVLTDRALRLMLAYGRPDRILCLTFTKAAAAEMANRIVAMLADWAVVAEPELRAKLKETTGVDPDEAALARARALFAQVVDVPGGLKVQTVHAFCQSALERFPIEAGAPPGFAALDERAAAELLTEARDATLRRIMSADASADLVGALDRMALRGAAEKLDELMRTLLGERARLEALGGTKGTVAAVLDALGFADEAAVEAEAARAAAPGQEMEAGWRRLAAAWRGGAKTDVKRGDALGEWLALPAEDRAGDLTPLFEAFFTKDGDGDVYANAATKGVLGANPWFAAAHADALAHAEQARDRTRLAASALDTLAAVRLAGAVGARYATMKATRAALDFDDLILKTRDLLLRDGGAGWALFKLDQGVDHILVDEAQDTNPEQWQVIHALADEFFRTDFAHGRTLFAVGDPKQSIFSFQRADPAEFARSRSRFQASALAAGQPFVARPLDISFRSVPAVLAAVDAVFSVAPARDGLAPDGAAPRHRAARAGLPGRVEFWPVMPEEPKPDADPWTPLTEYPPSNISAEGRLAEVVAETIKRLIDDPDERLPPARNRPAGKRIEAGDIMVVVQSRRAFGDALARALKARGVATAGVDRMRLSRQLAVRDLMALGQAAVLPEDDLALACFLKSPLGGLDEAALFDLAHGREDQSLWRRLKHAAADAPAESPLAAAWAFLRQAMERADFAPPFDFYQWALGPMAGRAKLVAGMGDAVLDPLDEFLSLALRYASERPASLSGFLAWIERESVEIKRELEGAASGVRLLTVHAAKGLQAPIVFLPDTTRGPSSPPKLLWLEHRGRRVPLLAATSVKKDADLATRLGEARAQANAEERRRLLYVAMTRAEDRLYIAGSQTGKKPERREPGCWHELIEAGMARLAGVDERPCPFSEAPFLVYDDPGDGAAVEATWEPETAPIQFVLPPWWGMPAPRPTAALAGPTLAPSSAVVVDADDPPAALSPLARGGRRAAEATRFGRGLLIHKLLERLPAVPVAERRRIGRAYLERAADLGASTLAATLQAALDLLDDPAFGHVFAASALAEAPIAGVIGGRRYAGVIDRLAIGPERVAIVDFKTNRPPPPDARMTPPAYLKQMALYRALARQAFPGRTIVTGLLWTEAPRLDELDDGLLDAFAPDG